MTALLQDYVTRQADLRPDAAAVVADETVHTYDWLEIVSNQLARTLHAAGCTRGDRVCLLLPKSDLAIASTLGILKADCIYVPIDVSNPAERIAKIIRSCEPRVLLAGNQAAGALNELWSVEEFSEEFVLGWMEPTDVEGATTARPHFCLGDVERCSSATLDSKNGSDDPAYILFTSGSTGFPKGVVITHANVIQFIEWAKEYFGLGSHDRLSGHPPLHFDLSILDTFSSFSAGAELHLVPPELNLLPHKLAAFIRTHALTQWFSVPSALNYMAKFDVVGQGDFPSLKRVLWCGEVLPTPGLIYWMERLPHVAFTNLYGPTETTIASSYYTVPEIPGEPRAAVPIGVACAGEELLVLDEDLQSVPDGEIGHLYVRGVGLSPGYWGDERATCAAFLPDPSSSDPSARIYRTGDLARIGDDGMVYFMGRADSQIKTRGYRIELGEVEAALSALDLLEECAVVAVGTEGFEGVAICCAYTPSRGKDVTPTTIKRELAHTLPRYMHPSRWVPLVALPRNSRGKVDRGALKGLF